MEHLLSLPESLLRKLCSQAPPGCLGELRRALGREAPVWMQTGRSRHRISDLTDLLGNDPSL
eukprot:scaffold342980_cov48-Prasinocladus_malaysianus.AAC.1